MCILKDLYYGTIYPSEQIVSKDPDYRKIGRQITEQYQYLTNRLSPEEIKHLETYENLNRQMWGMDCYANFEYGFRLGAALIRETLTEFDASLEAPQST